jgi:hypothetical protein
MEGSMELYVYNGNPPTKIAVAEGFQSVRLSQRYYSPGELEIIAPLGSSIRFQPGMIVWRRGMEEAYLIETVELRAGENGALQRALGRTHSALLERRVLAKAAYYEGTASHVIAAMIDAVFSAPARAFPNFIVTIDESLGGAIGVQPQITTLLRAVADICQGSSLGYRSAFDPISGNVEFSLYQGTDRANGIAPGRVVFDTAYDTISGVSSVESTRTSANAAYVLGEVDTSTHLPKREEVDIQSPTGYERFETLLRFNRTSATDAGGTMNNAQYRSAMREFGSAALRKLSRRTVVDGEIRADSRMYRLYEDYNVGDLVRLRVKEWGVEAAARITSVEQIFENGREWTKVYLGTDEPPNPTSE